jgi:plasmid stabilization system protein ParE
LAEALDWYDAKSVAVGNRFRADVEAALESIERAPESFPVIFPELRLRFYQLRRFPYLVFYRVDKSVIVVFGVVHGASNPEKWRRRVDPMT